MKYIYIVGEEEIGDIVIEDTLGRAKATIKDWTALDRQEGRRKKNYYIKKEIAPDEIYRKLIIKENNRWSLKR